jgi:hypothetical protein
LKLHQQALALYDTLAKDEAFMALDKFAKAERLKEKVREAIGTSDATTELTNKLIDAGKTAQEKGKVVQLNAQATMDSTVADTSLNGSQITSLVEIINQVSLGIISKETALPLIQAAFPGIDDASITKMLAGVKSVKPGSEKAAAIV